MWKVTLYRWNGEMGLSETLVANNASQAVIAITARYYGMPLERARTYYHPRRLSDGVWSHGGINNDTVHVQPAS